MPPLGFLAGLLALGGIGAAIGQAIFGVVISFGLRTLGRLLSPRPSQSALSVEASDVTIREPVPTAKIANGLLNRMSGPVTFAGISGTNGEFLHLVMTLTGHEVSGIGVMYIGDTVVIGNAAVEPVGGDYEGLIRIERALGSPNQKPYPELAVALPLLWKNTTKHRQRECAGVHIRLKHDPQKFSGIPDFSFDVQGGFYVDPRLVDPENPNYVGGHSGYIAARTPTLVIADAMMRPQPDGMEVCPNLIENADFENGDDGWTGGPNVTFVSEDQDNAFVGQGYVTMQALEGTASLLYPKFADGSARNHAVEPGEVLLFGGWGMLAFPEAPASGEKLRFILEFRNDFGTDPTNHVLEVTATDWARARAAIVVPDGKRRAAFRVELDAGTGTTVIARVDRVWLRKMSDAFDMDALIAAANIDDEGVDLKGGGTEPRYTVDGAYETSVEMGEVLRQMNAAHAGTISHTGSKFLITAGAYRAPTDVITIHDLRGTISIEPSRPRGELRNGISGLFLWEEAHFSPAEFPAQPPPARHAELVAEDHGEELWGAAVELPFTSSHTRAQRLVRIELEQSRRQRVYRLECRLSVFGIVPEDVVYLDLPPFEDRETREFKCVAPELVFEPDEVGQKLAGVNLVFREYSAEIYAWDPEVDELPMNNPDGTPTLPGEPPDPPTNVIAEDGFQSGVVIPRMRVLWTAPLDITVVEGGNFRVEFRRTIDSDWSFGGEVPGGETSILFDVPTTGDYVARVIAINTFQQESEPAESNQVTITVDGP